MNEPPSTSWTLNDLAALQEGWDFEAKEAQGRDGRGRLPDSFWETYSAMANTDGGQIVLGVNEREDRSLEVLGLREPERVETDLWNLLNNREKVSTNVLERRDVRIVEVNGARILVIDVPRARRNQRPVYLGPDPFSGTFIRTNDGDRHAERERVRRMLADADVERPADSVVLENYGFDDLHQESLSRYRQLLASRNPDHPFLSENDIGFLRQVRAWGRDRERDVEGPTLGGLLMFGKEGAIRDRLPQFFLEYRRDPADPQGARRWDDRLIPDGTWNANLLQFYWQVYPRLVEGLQVPFVLESGVRKGETPVHDALREALVNSLAHATHGHSAGVRVIRRQDGYTFINPGLMLVPPEQAIAGGESQCRNPSIQHQFVLVGLGERAGSGIPAIMQAWQSQHWRKPLIAEDPERDLTHLTLSMVSLLPEGVLEELAGQFPGFRDLEEEARLAVATARIEGEVTNRRLQQLTERHGRDLTLMLRSLVEQGLLVPHGGGRGTRYTIAEAASDSLESSPQSGANSPQSSPQSAASSPQSSPQSVVGGEQRFRNSEDPVSEVAERKWARRERVEAAILALCREEFMTTRDIAKHLDRQASTIHQNYVQSLLADGRLAPKYPGNLNHPNQAYRTAEPEARQ